MVWLFAAIMMELIVLILVLSHIICYSSFDMNTEKNFDELTITDDFIFCHVMQDKQICTELLTLVLSDKIGNIADIAYQQSFHSTAFAKGIRLDVWLTDDEGKTYDVEMQTTNQANLAKRLRYYQSIIDITTIEKGKHYDAEQLYYGYRKESKNNNCNQSFTDGAFIREYRKSNGSQQRGHRQTYSPT